MINFFRKNRKKLADQNKFLQYSRYAIGEIVLVMIGILLALQVNNWNQSRLKTVEANDYLMRLSEDLKSDTLYLANELKASIRETDSLSLFLELMYKNQNTHFEFMRLLKLSDWNPRNVHIQDNTFLEMNSSGKFDLIQSDELKTAILDYYSDRDFADEHIGVTIQHGFDMFMKVYPQLTRYYNYEELKQHDIFGKNDWVWINDTSNPSFKLLAASVSHFRFKISLTKSYCEKLHKKSTNILRLIEDANKK